MDPVLPSSKTKWSRTQNSTKEHLYLHTMSSHHYSFALQNTYFLFQTKCYEQVCGTANGLSISPIATNLLMEELQDCRKAKLMTPLSSKWQNTGFNFWNTSTPLTLTYSSLQRTPLEMYLCPFGYACYTRTEKCITYNSLQ